jgi:hypothetical protein
MPAGLIEKENGVGAGVDGETDFFQMLDHGMTKPAPLPLAGQIAPKI